MEGYIGGVIKHAPFYADMLREKGGDYKALTLKYTERLFCNPFDEQWVQDTKDRVSAEIALGHDMRSRPGIVMTILRDFNQRVAHGILRKHKLRLVDVATRVLMLDAAAAVALHYQREFRRGKSRADQLSAAIQEFRATTEGVRVCELGGDFAWRGLWRTQGAGGARLAANEQRIPGCGRHGAEGRGNGGGDRAAYRLDLADLRAGHEQYEGLASGGDVRRARE